MSHFARLDENNIVQQVVVANSIEWCEQAIPGKWVETFKDRSQRVNYASVGWAYDEARDAFIPPKPFESWVLNETTCLWNAPMPMPDDGQDYTWDEDAGDWVEVPSETV